MAKSNQLIMIYDFDGTLSKNTVPDYRALDKLGLNGGTRSFGFLACALKYKLSTGKPLGQAFNDYFFRCYVNQAKKTGQLLKADDFSLGFEKTRLHKGVDEYFQNISKAAKENGIELKNYCVTGCFSNYISKMDIAKNFSKIYGSELITNDSGDVIGLNSLTNKIEALGEILKCEKKEDCRDIVYFGDSVTDQDVMEFINDNGGESVFIRRPFRLPFSQGNTKSSALYSFPADYSEQGPIYKFALDAFERTNYMTAIEERLISESSFIDSKSNC